MLKRTFKTLAYISINSILILLIVQLVIFVFNESFEFGREVVSEIFYETPYYEQLDLENDEEENLSENEQDSNIYQNDYEGYSGE